MRFNQIEYAEFYQQQMIDAGYPGDLLPFILKELENQSTVLDIGSGTGFFSIPLAGAGHHVTAVEPSAEMINIMKKNLSDENLSLIKIFPAAWEHWKGAAHDAAICVHSLYPMHDIKKAISTINESAVKKIIIVRDSVSMKSLSGIVRDRLGISSNRDLNSEIINLLNELAVNWKVVNIHEERKHIISDLTHETDSILYQLKLDENFRDEIFTIIKSETDIRSGMYFFNAIYSDNAYIFR